MRPSLVAIGVLLVCMGGLVCCEGEDDSLAGVERYRIEGRVVRPDSSLVTAAEWFASTKVFTNSGHYGFLRWVLPFLPTRLYKCTTWFYD